MTKQAKNILVSQLIAARTQIDATLAVLCPDECEHPVESVVNLSVMGGDEKYRCGVCGEESNKPFVSVED